MLIPMKQAFEIGAKVLQKAESDPAFRALALSDGSAAVEQLLGSPLPDGIKVQFVESQRGTITLGIPPARSTDELSDRDLERVAGGRDEELAADIGINIAAEVPGVVAGFFRR